MLMFWGAKGKVFGKYLKNNKLQFSQITLEVEIIHENSHLQNLHVAKISSEALSNS